MSLTDQLAAEAVAHDPHGLKSKGETSAKHSFPAEPRRPFQKFPLAVYKEDSITVHNEDELSKALADGYSESDPSQKTFPPAEPVKGVSSASASGWKPGQAKR